MYGRTGALAAVGATAIAVLVGGLVIVHNRLAHLAESAARAWSLIDVQLQRRHDLIPALAAIVDVGRDHDRATLAARTQLAGTQPTSELLATADVEAHRQSEELRELFRLTRRRRTVEGDEFDLLRREIADTETRIVAARSFYEASVTLYDRRRRRFPGLLLAPIAARRRFPHFSGPALRRTVPKIEFDWDVGREI
ncbi:MAG: LemA family protein [Actinomycetota bacterium]